MILLTFFVIVFSLSISIYASDEEPGEVIPLAPDLDQQILYSLSNDIAESAASSGIIPLAATADYSQQIYLYLQSYLPTLYTNSNSNTQNIADIEAVLKILLRQLNDGMESLTSPSLYDLIEGIHEQLIPAESSFNLTLNDMIFTILYRLFGNTTIGDGNLLSDIRSIMSQNGLIASYLYNINEKTKDYTTLFNTNNSHLNTIRSYSVSINNFLKNFTFTNVPQTTKLYSLDNITYETIDNISGSFSGDIYFTIDSNLNSSDSFIYHVKLPIVGGVLANVRYYPNISVFTNNNYPQYNLKNTIYYIDSSSSTLDIYFVAPRFLYSGNSYFYIMIEDSLTTYFSSFKDIQFEFISNANQNKEYYSFLDFMINYNNQNNTFNISNDIHDLKEVYASDKELSSRKASQDVINETLDDFTGSGSAAAKKSDVSSAKDISNSLRSGLNSGGSMSDALSVLSPASSFWGWFSQDNANYFIVLTPSNNRSLRNTSSNEGFIIDIPDYQYMNDLEYFNFVGGYND